MNISRYHQYIRTPVLSQHCLLSALQLFKWLFKLNRSKLVSYCFNFLSLIDCEVEHFFMFAQFIFLFFVNYLSVSLAYLDCGNFSGVMQICCLEAGDLFFSIQNIQEGDIPSLCSIIRFTWLKNYSQLRRGSASRPFFSLKCGKLGRNYYGGLLSLLSKLIGKVWSVDMSVLGPRVFQSDRSQFYILINPVIFKNDFFLKFKGAF